MSAITLEGVKCHGTKKTDCSLNKLSHIHIIISRFLPLPIFLLRRQNQWSEWHKKKIGTKKFCDFKAFSKDRKGGWIQKKVGDFTRYIHDHHFM